MTRLHRWLTQGPFAIVSTGPSPAHPDKPASKQFAQMQELKQRVLQDGYGFQPAQGLYKSEITEPSIFIPLCSCRDAIAYGQMFRDDPHGPQQTIMFGEDGLYYLYRCEDGGMDSSGDVQTDFPVLTLPEMQQIEQEERDTDRAERHREPDRPSPTDPSRDQWREKQAKIKSSGRVHGMYFLSSAPGAVHYMGHFSGVKQITAVQDGIVRFNDPYLIQTRTGDLLFCLPEPEPDEVVLSNIVANLHADLEREWLANEKRDLKRTLQELRRRTGKRYYVVPQSEQRRTWRVIGMDGEPFGHHPTPNGGQTFSGHRDIVQKAADHFERHGP